MVDCDVIIIGAGLSGIGAACHLGRAHPGKRYTILEARDAIGGTWDLFRYPGIRSDSDMHTLGYAFKPWRGDKAIADGPAIRDYVREAAREHGVEAHIRFGHRVVAASWSSATATWTVTCERGPARERVVLTCRFVWSCSGYYRYDAGHTIDLPGRDSFAGRVVHPQHWPDDVAWAGRQVVVIGSGATAVTLVPELAKAAAHVVMLQRSPTYIVARPAVDTLADWLFAHLPERVAHDLVRWKNVLMGAAFYTLARRRPALVRRLIVARVQEELGPGFDVATHFTPRYAPWDQRLCLVPDSDLFAAVRDGRAEVVTDHIDALVPRGIRLRSGRELPADLIVTATGLELQFLGGVALDVDGRRVAPHELTTYKGAMLSGVPNLANTFGYTNASWTLRADLTAGFVCRLLAHMDRTGARQCTPRLPADAGPAAPLLDFSSGYVQRAIDRFPRQGARAPWKVYQSYLRDLVVMRLGRIADGALELR